MLSRTISFRLIGHLVLAALALATGVLLQNSTGAPAPQPKPPYALLYIPKKSGQQETIRYRREQTALISTKSAPFVLFWAIRSLKSTDLPSLPKKGKGGENRYNNEEDVAWLARNLKIEYLEGTGVLRISLAAGSRREQALLVNAIVHAYFRLEVHQQREHLEKLPERIQRDLKAYKKVSAEAKGENKKILEQAIVDSKGNLKRIEDELRTLPRLLELAEVPQK